MLWEKDQDSFVTFNVLDAVQFHENIITSWIFTSLSGTVKSKSKVNWTLDALSERCKQADHLNVVAHHYSHGRWTQLSSAEKLHDVFVGSDRSFQAVVSMGNVSGGSLIEQCYEASIDGLFLPKCSTFRLISQQAKGKSMHSIHGKAADAVPSERVLCMNKNTNRFLQRQIQELVKIAEDRKRIFIVKLKCIILFDESNVAVKEIIPNDSPTDRAWLHHVSEITYICKSELRVMKLSRVDENGIFGVSETFQNKILVPSSLSIRDRSVRGSERGGGTGSITSDVTHLSSSFNRVQKCLGDFCAYDEIEERMQMDADADLNVISESHKALQRHKRLEGRHKKSDGEGEEHSHGNKGSTLSPHRASAAGTSIHHELGLVRGAYVDEQEVEEGTETLLVEHL